MNAPYKSKFDKNKISEKELFESKGKFEINVKAWEALLTKVVNNIFEYVEEEFKSIPKETIEKELYNFLKGQTPGDYLDEMLELDLEEKEDKDGNENNEGTSKRLNKNEIPNPVYKEFKKVLEEIQHEVDKNFPNKGIRVAIGNNRKTLDKGYDKWQIDRGSVETFIIVGGGSFTTSSERKKLEELSDKVINKILKKIKEKDNRFYFKKDRESTLNSIKVFYKFPKL